MLIKFPGPLERYQWRVTASYYMCWFTMKETKILEHLSETCDNFADCLDPRHGPFNEDIRADDNQPYACALYRYIHSLDFIMSTEDYLISFPSLLDYMKQNYSFKITI